MNAADRGMGLGLRALNRLAGLELLDRIGMRDRAERAALLRVQERLPGRRRRRRAFAPAQEARRARAPGEGRERADLFDLTPTDEQQMMREAIGDFAIEKLRPAALDADEACAAPEELLEQANELGVTMLGIPGELDGAFEERSAVTSVLVAEQLARGDMGLALAVMAPAAVGTAIGLWGDADQQATYLPEFAGESPPAAALALIEPRRAVRPEEARDQGPSATATASCSTARSRSSRARRTPSCSWSPPSWTGRARRCSSSRRRSRASPSPLSRRWACAPPRPAAWRSTASSSAAGALLGDGGPGDLRGLRAPGPPRLVRARRRHVAGRARLPDPLRERAHRVRRADLAPPGGRVRRRQRRDRARRHAPCHLPRREPRRPGPRQLARGRAGAPPGRPATGCRSAPTASSSSAATATRRSTRSSAGTATCGRPA